MCGFERGLSRQYIPPSPKGFGDIEINLLNGDFKIFHFALGRMTNIVIFLDKVFQNTKESHVNLLKLKVVVYGVISMSPNPWGVGVYMDGSTPSQNRNHFPG